MGNYCQEHLFQLHSNYLINNRIIHTTLVLSMEVFEPFVGYYFFNVLLMVLQTLHIFWAGLILRMVYKFLKGKVRISSTAETNHRHSSFHILNFNIQDMALNFTPYFLLLSADGKG